MKQSEQTKNIAKGSAPANDHIEINNPDLLSATFAQGTDTFATFSSRDSGNNHHPEKTLSAQERREIAIAEARQNKLALQKKNYDASMEATRRQVIQYLNNKEEQIESMVAYLEAQVQLGSVDVDSDETLSHDKIKTLQADFPMIGIVPKVGKMVAQHEEEKRQARSRLFSDWELNVFLPIQRAVWAETDKIDALQLSKMKAKLFDEYLHAENKKMRGLFRDTIIEDEYNPMKAHEHDIKINDICVDDPTLRPARIIENEIRLIQNTYSSKEINQGKCPHKTPQELEKKIQAESSDTRIDPKDYTDNKYAKFASSYKPQRRLVVKRELLPPLALDDACIQTK